MSEEAFAVPRPLRVMLQQRGSAAEESCMEGRIKAWSTCADALHRDGEESLRQAAQRVLKRAKRLGTFTLRTQVAQLIVHGFGGVDRDPWPRIIRAAELWQRGQS